VPLRSLTATIADARLPFDEELFDTVRGRLATVLAHDDLRDEADDVAAVLIAWGSRAAPAVPELVALLDDELAQERPVTQTLCRALAAIGPAASPAVPRIRDAVSRGFNTYDRIGAAAAVYDLADDPQPLLDTVLAELAAAQRDEPPFELNRLHRLGAHAAPALPTLRRHLADRTDRPRINSVIAGVLWRLEADPAAVLPTLQLALSIRDGSRYNPNAGPPTEAFTLAAELGPHAWPLAEPLRVQLGERIGWKKVDAATALWRIGELTETELIEVVLPEPERFEYWSHDMADRALELVREARATRALPRLRGYLATDKRIRYGSTHEMVRKDERLCARIERLIADLDS
jgi:hypothetical protein